eukprot:tig00000448_g885.t1
MLPRHPTSVPGWFLRLAPTSSRPPAAGCRVANGSAASQRGKRGFKEDGAMTANVDHIVFDGAAFPGRHMPNRNEGVRPLVKVDPKDAEVKRYLELLRAQARQHGLQFRTQFLKYDANRDGVVSAEELAKDLEFFHAKARSCKSARGRRGRGRGRAGRPGTGHPKYETLKYSVSIGDPAREGTLWRYETLKYSVSIGDPAREGTLWRVRPPEDLAARRRFRKNLAARHRAPTRQGGAAAGVAAGRTAGPAGGRRG